MAHGLYKIFILFLYRNSFKSSCQILFFQAAFRNYSLSIHAQLCQLKSFPIDQDCIMQSHLGFAHEVSGMHITMFTLCSFSRPSIEERKAVVKDIGWRWKKRLSTNLLAFLLSYYIGSIPRLWNGVLLDALHWVFSLAYHMSWFIWRPLVNNRTDRHVLCIFTSRLKIFYDKFAVLVSFKKTKIRTANLSYKNFVYRPTELSKDLWFDTTSMPASQFADCKTDCNRRVTIRDGQRAGQRDLLLQWIRSIEMSLES